MGVHTHEGIQPRYSLVIAMDINTTENYAKAAGGGGGACPEARKVCVCVCGGGGGGGKA